MEQNCNGYSPDFSKDSVRAFTYVYNKYSSTIYLYASRYINDEDVLKDILSETFLKLWKIRDRVSEVDSIEAYIRGIAYNCCIDHLRRVAIKTKVHQELLYKLESSSGRDSWEDPIRVAVIEYVANKIEELPVKHQLIYKLCFVDGLDNEEIAERVRMSKKTVINIRCNIIKFLRYSLQERDLLALFIAFLGFLDQK